MKRTVLINATSLASGGGLTILNERLIVLGLNAEDDADYYVFMPDTCNYLSRRPNIICVRNADNKYYRSRNYWNLFGMRQWCKANSLWPDELFSLQNYFPYGFRTGVTRKTLYLHQPIPFFPFRWSLLRKDERILWFYKNIYYFMIKASVREADQVIVQTEWLRKRVVEIWPFARDKIVVERPLIKTIDVEGTRGIDGLKGEHRLFYPASEVIYKNHEVLYKAMDIIVNHYKIDDVVLYLTLDAGSPTASRYIKEYKLHKNIVLTGQLSYEEVMSYYKSATALVFPSKIETFGLPLIEAQQFGLPIIASDLELYREVMGEYDGTIVYCSSDNPHAWAKAVVEQITASL